jgi:hypothetical protein
VDNEFEQMEIDTFTRRLQAFDEWLAEGFLNVFGKLGLKKNKH